MWRSAARRVGCRRAPWPGDRLSAVAVSDAAPARGGAPPCGPEGPPDAGPGGPGGSGIPGENPQGGQAGDYHNVDVHGAGSQRSDPKAGDPAMFPHGRGPQGDVIRIYNYVRLVRPGSEP